MIKIQVENTDGQIRTLNIDENPSTSLMEVLTEEDFDVPAICGGMAGCGTCHVQVQSGFKGLPAPDDDEEFMLDSLPNLTDSSRLSCQLKLTPALDGLEIRILGDGIS